MQATTDPEQTRAALPSDYDVRGRALLLRMVLAGTAFVVGAALAGAGVWWLLGCLLGERRLHVAVAATSTAELIFAAWWCQRWAHAARMHGCMHAA